MNTRSCASTIFCLGVLSFVATGSARTEEFQQRGVHEHGKVTINAAVDGKDLVIELDSPAVNVVGFEHEPRTDAERAAVRDASDLLKSGRGLFGTPPQALCTFRTTDLKAPRWEPSHSEPGKHDEQEHHADYEARFTYRCEAPEHLAWLEPLLVDKLRKVTEVHVNVATAAGQRSESVTTGHARVALR
jgi:hypothetical protein